MMRACLIVDNPLRDLDGLALVAWHVAQTGGEAYLVPMYTQGFDVPAIAPNVVLANYVRRNNAELLKLYHRLGIAVVVLDTEGAVGKSAEDNANLVAGMNCATYVDRYCLWGERQYEAFRARRALPESAMRTTGCPRYDFCAPQWRAALPRPSIGMDYVLVNTNFPIANPRYSPNTETELAGWIATGIDAQWARQFAVDARKAYRHVIETVQRLAGRFPRQRFVLRPHPFERASAYDELGKLSNCDVRQEGTSLEWLNAARLLLHQNCSTAVEAAMLGVEPVSLEWFNSEALYVPGPTTISHAASSFEALEEMVAGHLDGRRLEPNEAQCRARTAIVREQYFSNDGAAAKRVANVLAEAASELPPRRAAPASLRARVMQTARVVLGYRGFERVRRLLKGREAEARRAKHFSMEQVERVIERIDAASGAARRTQLAPVSAAQRRWRTRPSGTVVRVTLARGQAA